jgi:hypothetical protein
LERAARLDAQQRAAAAYRFQQAARLRRELECPVKKCPGCKTPTQKTMGCDHMRCSIRKCGVDWCWSCGKQFDAEKIYRHMSKVHGGWYAGGAGLDFGELSEDEDRYERGE